MKGLYKTASFALVFASLTILIACDPGDPAPGGQAQETSPIAELALGNGDPQAHSGDLNTIIASGTLRILVHRDNRQHLVRNDFPANISAQWLNRFAQGLGLSTRMVTVDNFEDLIPALQQGRGDVIASNLTALPERREQALFSRPLHSTREYLVAPATSAIGPDSDLSGMTLAVQSGTSFAESAAELQRQQPGLRLVAIDGKLGQEMIFDQMLAGEFDFTIADGNYLAAAKHYRKDIRGLYPVSVDRDIAWAVRLGSARLLGELNRFISGKKLASRGEFRSQGDLAKIQKRGVLRVALHNTMASYYLWRGELYGFEYELARRFASERDLNLHILVAHNFNEMMQMLREGQADIAAAFITPTPWRETINITYSETYHYASEILVSRPQDTPESLEQLHGRVISVRKSSSYWQTLQSLVTEGSLLRLQAADENLDTERLIDQVGRGAIDLTVADSHLLALERTWRDDVVGDLSLGPPRPQSWAVRENNPQLLHAVNQFFDTIEADDFYNTTFRRYFEEDHIAAKWQPHSLGQNAEGSLSPYDALIKRMAEAYNFDWLLLSAQVYQESRFDASVRSWSGAQGLLQVLPQTARSMGLYDLQDPAMGLEAGVKRLQDIRQQFSDIPDAERRWFTLASYHSGIGHTNDARRIATQLGLDPDRWFDNVEQGMILLSQAKYARQSRHGYVRGVETAQYVQHVQRHYQTFKDLQRQSQTDP